MKSIHKSFEQQDRAPKLGPPRVMLGLLCAVLFQYGSNCSTERLNGPDRLNGAAEIEGCDQTVDEFDIAFHVWSSGKECAAANLIPVRGTGCQAWGILYQTSEKGLQRLRQIEGPRYEEKAIRVRNCAGEIVEAATFLVKADDRQSGLWTSAKYVSYIVRGLRDQKALEGYTQHVIDVAIRTNEEAEDQNSAQSELPFLEALRALI
jgi:hypothetical protein